MNRKDDVAEALKRAWIYLGAAESTLRDQCSHRSLAFRNSFLGNEPCNISTAVELRPPLCVLFWVCHDLCLRLWQTEVGYKDRRSSSLDILLENDKARLG